MSERCRLLETSRPSPEALRALLLDGDAAVVHATVLHVERRFRSDEREPSLWAELLPPDLFALPLESQEIVAGLIVDGLPRQPGERPATLPPSVELAWLRAALLQAPALTLQREPTALTRAALETLPLERTIATDLLAALVESQDPTTRLTAVELLARGLERGLVDAEATQGALLALAKAGPQPVALASLRLLSEAWACALPLPARAIAFQRDAEALDVDLAIAEVRLLASRREVELIRRLAAMGSTEPAVERELCVALGAIGAAKDVPWILDRLSADPRSFGLAALDALVLLKRRGLSCTGEQARALVALLFAHSFLDVSKAGEALSSHADVLAAMLDGPLATFGEATRAVELLLAFATRGAVARLRATLTRESERAAWWAAARALGRLGVSEAEPELLDRLDDEPEACLSALRQVGGAQTIRALSERLERDVPAPAWLPEAARLLFLLDPQEVHLLRLAQRGELTAPLLDALPGHGTLAQSATLHALLHQPTHPLRGDAIAALGRTGGPLAIDALAALLTDDDEEIRQHTLAALRALGQRLHAADALRPAAIASAADPGETAVAEAVLLRLRDRRLDAELVIRLLEALPQIAHPQLINVVRPYLRARDPEIQKRVLAALAAAGPAASAYVLPWLGDEDVTIARQALSTLARLEARWLAAPIATWLEQSNMNLKKSAAEALVTAGDPACVPALLHWLATHDNPGFRELLLQALQASAGRWQRALLLTALRTAQSPRAIDLLLDALDGTLAPDEIAALLGVFGAPSWTERLLERIEAGTLALKSGNADDLDRALRRWGLSSRLHAPHGRPAHGAARDAAPDWRVEALRARARLKTELASHVPGEAPIEALASLLRAASQSRDLTLPALTAAELHTLLDLAPRFAAAARAGLLYVLAHNSLDPVVTLRAARLAREFPVEEVPAALLRAESPRWTVETARRFLDASDQRLRDAAERTLLLADAVDGGAWFERDARRLVAHLLRAEQLEAAFAWSRKHERWDELIDELARLLGPRAAIAQLRSWTPIAPAMIPALLRLGLAGQVELERLVRSTELPLLDRAAALNGIVGGPPTGARLALFAALLDDEHALIREPAARELLRIGDRGHREQVLAAHLKGRFRESFRVSLDHDDLPFLSRALPASAPAERLRLVALVERLQDPHCIPLLLELWHDSDVEVRARAGELLRAHPFDEVLPWALPLIAKGQLAVLQVLQPTRALPAALLAHRDQQPDWTRFLEQMAASGPLHAPGLADTLAADLGGSESPDGWRLLVRIGDWSDTAASAQLARVLEPVLRGPARESLLATIVETIAERPAALRVSVLASLGRASDRGVVVALCDTVLQHRALAARLSPSLLAAVERELSAQLAGGDLERIRKILSFRAARAESEIDRARLVEQLEAACTHPAARVRLHALRLLRAHAPRARYLAATRGFLDDGDPSTVRSAVRTLAFGGDLASVPALAELISHSDAGVREAARDGILHLGEPALAGLTRAIAHARPDHRRALDELAAELTRRAAHAEDTPS